jgi:hypothetical protein
MVHVSYVIQPLVIETTGVLVHETVRPLEPRREAQRDSGVYRRVRLDDFAPEPIAANADQRREAFYRVR